MGVRGLAVAAAAAQLILLGIVSTASASVVCPADEKQPTMDNAYEAAAAIVCDVNNFRVQNGLRPLRWDWRLWRAAQNQADDMAANHYFGHVSADGRRLTDRVQPTGYIPNGPTWSLGENLGWGTSYLSAPLSIVVGWINSPEHRDNMLDPEYRDIGIGMNQGPVTQDGQSGVIFVADFGMRATPVDTLRISGRPSLRAQPAGSLPRPCKLRSYSKATNSSASLVRRTIRMRCSS